ncbi:uncharacterized protein LOC106012139 [Aplysia californica]|uniref:Uncharacterized protein LOC106012139 n=1 Tax=Aplysia californica TaxID=6500 RepID=A0ABM1A2K1_APLCA|nr:uncharacterized protein LOC106012139 [Aplysia californica]
MARHLFASLVLPLVTLGLTFVVTSAAGSATKTRRTKPCCMPDTFFATTFNMGAGRWSRTVADFTRDSVISYIIEQPGDFILCDGRAGKQYVRWHGKCRVSPLAKQYIPRCIADDASLLYESYDVVAWEVDNADVQESWVLSRDQCIPKSAVLLDKKTGHKRFLSFMDAGVIAEAGSLFSVDLSACVEA